MAYERAVEIYVADLCCMRRRSLFDVSFCTDGFREHKLVQSAACLMTVILINFVNGREF